MDDTTRQQLLELVYGLLPDEDADRLRARIEAEPEMARAFEEARANAALLGEAARLPVAKIHLKRPMATAGPAPQPRPPNRAVKGNGHIGPSWARWVNWVVGLAAGILLLTSLGGFLYHRGKLRELAAANMRLRVTGPAVIPAGVGATYRIDTTTITGEPLPAEIEFALYSPDDKRLLWYEGDTAGKDRPGYLEVDVPADKELPERAVIRVAALRSDAGDRDEEERVELDVAVEPVRYATRLVTDRPLYRPGETVYYRSLTLSRFGLSAEREVALHFEIRDPDGAEVPGSQLEGATERGVGNGAFPLPKGLADGEYILAARSLEGAFPEVRRPFHVYRGGLPPAEEESESAPAGPGEVRVEFFPEGGDLVAGLENRVYFIARNPRGEPIDIEGTVVDPSGVAVALAETRHRGMGSFTFTPAAERRYRLEVRTPEGIQNKPELPQVNDQRQVVLNTGLGVFEPGSPLEFNVRAAGPDLPLVAAAYCRGIQVGQTALVTHSGENRDDGANAVAISLPEDLGGVIRLTVFDYSLQPPKPVAERLVYRRPAQYLEVRPTGHREAYAAGEKVEMAIVVTDEQGEPVPAAVSVAVADESLLDPAGGGPAGVDTWFLLAGEVKNPRDLEDADFYSSGGPEAAVALDLLLGVRGWRRFVDRTLPELLAQRPGGATRARLAALRSQAQPPAVFDNLGAIRERFVENLNQYQSRRTRLLTTLVTLSFFGGLGLLLLVTMLGILKVVRGVHLWPTVAAVAACCVVVGFIWMNPASRRFDLHGLVAFAPFEAPPEPGGGEQPRESGRPAESPAETEQAEAPHEEESREEAVAEPPPPADGPDAPEQPVETAGEAARDEAEGREVGRRREARFQDRLRERRRPQPSAAADGDPKEPAGARRGLREKLDKMGVDDLAGAPGKDLEGYRFSVREYAHQYVPEGPDGAGDFAETLYWSPLRIADENGRVEISFEMSDLATTFRVLADAHGAGRIGSAEVQVSVRSE